jgi:hypothetical protein
MSAVCRSCQQPVEWVRTKKGTAMPLDLPPTPEGNMVLVDGIARMRTPEDAALEPRQSHFVTCPHSKDWRR